jgi:Alkylmercury lyase
VTAQAAADDSAVRLEVYRAFVELGRAPVAAEIAEALGADQVSVEQALRRLADAHVLVLAPGTPYVWMANPFSAIPTPFAVDAGGRTLYGNCIWDGLGVVAVMGGTGIVRTWCPDCGERLAVAVESNRLAHGDGVVHFAVPAASWWDDIGFN